MTTKKETQNNIITYILLFLLGVLIAMSGFTIWQYSRQQKDIENLKKDIVTIVTQYNNLVTTLKNAELLGPSTLQPTP